MINTYKYGEETWIDIDRGTPEEIQEIVSTYGIHPFVGKELTSFTPKSRVEFHDKYIYCIMHFPAWKHTHGEDKNQEIDFVIGKNILITARYDTIDALHKFGKELEVGEILKKFASHGKSKEHFIFMNMLRTLYASIFEELEYIEDVAEGITTKIFKGKEKEMVVTISEVTRTLLDFKKITEQHQEILESLANRGEEIFGKDFSDEIESITRDYHKISTAIKTNVDLFRELRQTDDSLLTAKQNETIKRLTLIGAICFIISIIISLVN
jgi:magnesium transporter